MEFVAAILGIALLLMVIDEAICRFSTGTLRMTSCAAT